MDGTNIQPRLEVVCSSEECLLTFVLAVGRRGRSYWALGVGNVRIGCRASGTVVLAVGRRASGTFVLAAARFRNGRQQGSYIYPWPTFDLKSHLKSVLSWASMPLSEE